ncbi:hypothetical protein J6590_096860 [Homalodisca vitripennis]|nr:hypothetical protein J6590_096860 [Homalodisca vitripennis]
MRRPRGWLDVIWCAQSSDGAAECILVGNCSSHKPAIARFPERDTQSVLLGCFPKPNSARTVLSIVSDAIRSVPVHLVRDPRRL